MRRASAAHNPGVSLFPFLAVLICTMGVMMLLLVIINRPGAAAIDDSAPPPDAIFGEGGTGSAATLAALNGNGGASDAAKAAAGRLQAERELLEARATQLQIAREKAMGNLQSDRRQLSIVEDGMRTLRDQWAEVKKLAGDIEQADGSKEHDNQEILAAIERLKSALAATRDQLGKAVNAARSQPPAFAIIPFDGSNGTRRQPIYIECRSDSVVLQPEGIVLEPKDFKGPKGEGNPLASTIRAARDYLAGGTAPTPGREPYPLLIVRSDGIEAFYLARAAMSSWGTDFGYELVEADRKLAFQQPSPQLATIERAALADARSRYAWFATTDTGKEQEQAHHPQFYRASKEGGITTEGQASLPDLAGGGSSSPFGSAFGGSGSGTGGNGTGGNAAGNLGVGGNGTGGSGLGGGGSGAPGSRFGVAGTGNGYGGPGTGNGYGVAGTGTGPGNGSGYGTGGSGYSAGGSGPPGTSRAGNAGAPGNGGSGNGAAGYPAGAPGNGQPYVPGSNYIGLSGSGGPSGSGYGSGGGPGGVGNGSPLGAGSGAAGQGTGYLGAAGPGGPGAPSHATGTGGTGTGGTGIGGTGIGGTGIGGTGIGGTGIGGTGTGGPALGSSTGTGGYGIAGTGNGGVPGAGALAGYPSGTSASGTQSGTFGATGGSFGTNPSASFGSGNGSTGNGTAGAYANNQTGPTSASGASGATPGDPNAAPPPGSPTGNVTLAQTGGPSGNSGDPNNPGGDSAGSGALSMMMNRQSQAQKPCSSDIYNTETTPYPQSSSPQQPHVGEYIETPPQQSYPDKPKPPDDNAPHHDSLAEKRGRNWSLPSTAKMSTPVERAIHIECRSDCLILKPDFANPQTRVIPLGPRTADSVDKLVAAVWDYAKGWGIAGHQMYWKPRLELELGQSGEGRFSELQALMANSGLEVIRKQPTATAAGSTTQFR